MNLHPARALLKYEHRLLGLMLVSLLAAVMLIDDVYLSKSLLIVHFGLFLLWQPVLEQQVTFSTKKLLILFAFLGSFIIWFNIWTATFWILLLMSLLTGRIFARGLGRAIYGISVVILFLDITLLLTPKLFKLAALSDTLTTGIQVALLIASSALVFSPANERQSTHVDFIRGFMVVLLTLFLCMGSVLSTYNTDNLYLPSLVSTLFIAGIFLLATAILWTPRGGFAGLAQLWEKYLLNIGGPFEQWVSQLAALEANTNIKPDGFLETCVHYLLARHWICGIYWKTDKQDMMEGVQTSHHVSYSDNKLRMTLYAYNPIGPALLLHTKLLLSVLTFYYRAKLQEQQLIKQAHLRAIYETGSKLTHDIKNILQSTQTLTQVIADEQTTVEDARDLLQKQLPLLTQRLKTTLDKLSTPESSSAEHKKLSQWWQQLQSRYTGRNIAFIEEIDQDVSVPVEVFDTVAENLLDNARAKRITEKDLEIEVKLTSKDGDLTLTVIDDGKPIREEITERLFAEVISSESGFGIGLYQARQLALRSNYDLTLKDNTDGNVCFLLTHR